MTAEINCCLPCSFWSEVVCVNEEVYKSQVLRFWSLGWEMCDVWFGVITDVFLQVESIYGVIHKIYLLKMSVQAWGHMFWHRAKQLTSYSSKCSLCMWMLWMNVTLWMYVLKKEVHQSAKEREWLAALQLSGVLEQRVAWLADTG